MEYKQLGNTDLCLSTISFGCAPLGGVYGEFDEDEAKNLIIEAINKGINYFDTSPYYGLTKSEQVLGEVLKNIPRNKYYLSTKVGRYGLNEFNFSPDHIKNEFNMSLKRLNVDYVDILFVHDIEFGNLDFIIECTIPALRELQNSGKCRYIGITGYPLDALDYIIDRVEIDCCLSYCHYNLQNNMLSNFLDKWISKGVGVINASPLAMGLLKNNGPPNWHPASTQVKNKCREVALYCQNKRINLVKIAIQYSICHNNLSTTLIGISNQNELGDNLKWINSKDPLSNDVENMLETIHNMEWKS